MFLQDVALAILDANVLWAPCASPAAPPREVATNPQDFLNNQGAGSPIRRIAREVNDDIEYFPPGNGVPECRPRFLGVDREPLRCECLGEFAERLSVGPGRPRNRYRSHGTTVRLPAVLSPVGTSMRGAERDLGYFLRSELAPAGASGRWV
jgi:hypothetical protein